MARLTTIELQQNLRKSLSSDKGIGTFIGIPSGIPYELANLAGFDWVISDLEHGENEFAQLAQAVVAFGGPVVARVSSPSAENISRALDRGATGIMIPKLSSEQDLLSALAFLDYPPIGSRGVASYNRSAAWGHDQTALAGSKPVSLIQVETTYAVNEIDSLASNSRVDALFIGPLDLSYALGVPRDFSSDKFSEAISKVLDSCKRNGKPVGILANSGEVAANYLAQGFDFVAIGSDTVTLLESFKKQLQAAKESQK